MGKKNLENSQPLNSKLLLGSLIGGAIGVAVAILCDSKKCSQLRDTFNDVCDTVTDRAYDLRDNLMQHGEELQEKIEDWRHSSFSHDFSNRYVIISGLAGAILGSAALYALSEISHHNEPPRSFSQRVNNISSNVKEKSEHLTDAVRYFLRSISENLSDKEEKVQKFADTANSKIDNIVDLLNLGLRVFHSIKR